MYNKKVTVFCAASRNCDSLYLEKAGNLGKLIALSGREIIYGGGKIGLMGALAEGVLSEGGKITGIIPTFLNDMELGHNGITELKEVEGLHPRESIMLLESGCIIALPGGIGTLSELLQAITWKRLGRIESKILILNLNGYFNPLLEMLDKAIKENFLREEFTDLWTVVDSVEDVMIELEKKMIFVNDKNNLD